LNNAVIEYAKTQGLTGHGVRYFSWSDNQNVQIHRPHSNFPFTVFAAEISDLGTPLRPDNLATLVKGFVENFEALPERILEDCRQKTVRKQLQLKTKFAFHKSGSTRKRWQRVFYYRTPDEQVAG
jgi:hypothetical protein